ncbi:unnamed protein product [Didymodactylos carnosus]|uniref:Uncharacterized protein n=1 Tax=Didymodactylos carnosus TaxID=1234261 RepID=A0A8S2CPR5_9BILA|nr:unnamed protein product [Didymodactylos carnosus]CAF3525878.1 unnamed protein product [Didymodactylos carnosus]
MPKPIIAEDWLAFARAPGASGAEILVALKTLLKLPNDLPTLPQVTLPGGAQPLALAYANIPNAAIPLGQATATVKLLLTVIYDESAIEQQNVVNAFAANFLSDDNSASFANVTVDQFHSLRNLTGKDFYNALLTVLKTNPNVLTSEGFGWSVSTLNAIANLLGNTISITAIAGVGTGTQAETGPGLFQPVTITFEYKSATAQATINFIVRSNVPTQTQFNDAVNFASYPQVGGLMNATEAFP